MIKEAKILIRRHWILYLTGIFLIYCMKYGYSRAGISELKWILAPTARWVRILSGIPFTYEPQIGYVNHDHHFIIAASCSGIQFMIITTTTLFFSFVHRQKNTLRGLCWLVLSCGGAYLYTVLINGIRIIISIQAPFLLTRLHSSSRWLTPEKLHTIIGIVIYVTALLAIYHAVGLIWSKRGKIMMVPMFWYLFISLAVPFLNQAYRYHPADFTEYAAMVITASSIVFCVFHLTVIMKKHR